MVHSPPVPHRLEHLLQHLAHLLPAQGPIGVFIHHNTLHAFQHLPFEKAVTEAARVFQTEPYMKESDYRAAFERGRIRPSDLQSILQAEGIDTELRRLMLVPGLRDFRQETIAFEIHERGLVDHYRDDLPATAAQALANSSAADLFEFWDERVPPSGSGMRTASRCREGVLALTGIDIDDVVHPMLIKLTAAYLDQGMAYWTMPNREQGLWLSVTQLLTRTAIAESALRDLRAVAVEWSKLKTLEALEEALEVLGVEEGGWEAFLQAELLALPGWAGLASQLEKDPSLSPHEVVPITLADFVAVKLLLTVAATQTALGDAKQWRVNLRDEADREALRLVEAATYFDISQLAGLHANQLRGWKSSQVESFRAAIARFDDWERRRIWHAAYELRHERQILLPLKQHAEQGLEKTPDRLEAQVFFCIDDREESIRRHLEEIDPQIETFGAAGFFGVAMNYTGMDDAHGVSLCPVVVKPAHAIEERPVQGHEESNSRRQKLRRAWAKLARESFISSRTLVRGWLGTTVLGIFSLFPLAARILSPRRYGKWMEWLNASILPEPRTELTFMRTSEQAHLATEGLLQGFSVAEKADRVEGVLAPAGLRKGMARLVVVLGHGSSSLNNPHESAYDCGACGGRRGGPNARIFAAMANHPAVRQELRQRGIAIPDDTVFVGGYHDTANDNIDLYDLENLPATHAADLQRVRATLDAARAASAHERTRRFESASKSRNTADGLRHVQGRSEHLAEPRPEYGHSSNAVCVVGRRSMTRGLFLDRRAFLVSYDPSADPTNSNLARLLGAVIPVCAGISLEYYFSYVDNQRYGCGTKLPHNITGLLGVMDGYESDLRTGLTLQMVEIHEPVRILFVIEATRKAALEVIQANPLLWEFLSNRWIRLAVVDPNDGRKIHAYRGGDQWEEIAGGDELLGKANSSQDWYHGKLQHLPVARIGRRLHSFGMGKDAA